MFGGESFSKLPEAAEAKLPRTQHADDSMSIDWTLNMRRKCWKFFNSNTSSFNHQDSSSRPENFGRILDAANYANFNFTKGNNLHHHHHHKEQLLRRELETQENQLNNVTKTTNSLHEQTKFKHNSNKTHQKEKPKCQSSSNLDNYLNNKMFTSKRLIKLKETFKSNSSFEFNSKDKLADTEIESNQNETQNENKNPKLKLSGSSSSTDNLSALSASSSLLSKLLNSSLNQLIEIDNGSSEDMQESLAVSYRKREQHLRHKRNVSQINSLDNERSREVTSKMDSNSIGGSIRVDERDLLLVSSSSFTSNYHHRFQQNRKSHETSISSRNICKSSVCSIEKENSTTFQDSSERKDLIRKLAANENIDSKLNPTSLSLFSRVTNEKRAPIGQQQSVTIDECLRTKSNNFTSAKVSLLRLNGSLLERGETIEREFSSSNLTSSKESNKVLAEKRRQFVAQSGQLNDSQLWDDLEAQDEDGLNRRRRGGMKIRSKRGKKSHLDERNLVNLANLADSANDSSLNLLRDLNLTGKGELEGGKKCASREVSSLINNQGANLVSKTQIKLASLGKKCDKKERNTFLKTKSPTPSEQSKEEECSFPPHLKPLIKPLVASCATTSNQHDSLLGELSLNVDSISSADQKQQQVEVEEEEEHFKVDTQEHSNFNSEHFQDNDFQCCPFCVLSMEPPRSLIQSNENLQEASKLTEQQIKTATNNISSLISSSSSSSSSFSSSSTSSSSSGIRLTNTDCSDKDSNEETSKQVSPNCDQFVNSNELQPASHHHHNHHNTSSHLNSTCERELCDKLNCCLRITSTSNLLDHSNLSNLNHSITNSTSHKSKEYNLNQAINKQHKEAIECSLNELEISCFLKDKSQTTELGNNQTFVALPSLTRILERGSSGEQSSENEPIRELSQSRVDFNFRNQQDLTLTLTPTESLTLTNDPQVNEGTLVERSSSIFELDPRENQMERSSMIEATANLARVVSCETSRASSRLSMDMKSMNPTSQYTRRSRILQMNNSTTNFEEPIYDVPSMSPLNQNENLNHNHLGYNNNNNLQTNVKVVNVQRRCLSPDEKYPAEKWSKKLENKSTKVSYAKDLVKSRVEQGLLKCDECCQLNALRLYLNNNSTSVKSAFLVEGKLSKRSRERRGLALTSSARYRHVSNVCHHLKHATSKYIDGNPRRLNETSDKNTSTSTSNPEPNPNLNRFLHRSATGNLSVVALDGSNQTDSRPRRLRVVSDRRNRPLLRSRRKWRKQASYLTTGGQLCSTCCSSNLSLNTSCSCSLNDSLSLLRNNNDSDRTFSFCSSCSLCFTSDSDSAKTLSDLSEQLNSNSGSSCTELERFAGPNWNIQHRIGKKQNKMFDLEESESLSRRSGRGSLTEEYLRRHRSSMPTGWLDRHRRVKKKRSRNRNRNRKRKRKWRERNNIYFASHSHGRHARGSPRRQRQRQRRSSSCSRSRGRKVLKNSSKINFARLLHNDATFLDQQTEKHKHKQTRDNSAFTLSQLQAANKHHNSGRYRVAQAAKRAKQHDLLVWRLINERHARDPLLVGHRKAAEANLQKRSGGLNFPFIERRQTRAWSGSSLYSGRHKARRRGHHKRPASGLKPTDRATMNQLRGMQKALITSSSPSHGKRTHYNANRQSLQQYQQHQKQEQQQQQQQQQQKLFMEKFLVKAYNSRKDKQQANESSNLFGWQLARRCQCSHCCLLETLIQLDSAKRFMKHQKNMMKD